MPLSFAHPAAVLPLFRGPLVPTALIVGSMSPDVPYFLRATGISVSARARLAWALAGAAAAGLAGAAVMTALRWERETTAEHVLSSAAVGAGLGIAVAIALAVAAWWLIHLTRNGADSGRR